MLRFFHLHLPRRTVALAVSETCLVAALFLAISSHAHGQPWIWLRYEGGLTRIGLATAIFLLCMYYYDLYDSLVVRSLRETLTRLPEVLGTVYLVLAIVYLVVPALRLQLASVLLGVGLVGFAVAIVRQTYVAISGSPRLAEPFILQGDGPLAEALKAEIRKRPELGIRLLCVPPDELTRPRDSVRKTNDLSGVVNGRSIGVILAEDGDSDQPLETWKHSGRVVLHGVELYEIVTGKVWLGSLTADKVGQFRPVGVSRLQLHAQRLVTLLVSFSLLLITLPVIGLVALVVWLESGSPVIFRQKRVGRNGHQFTLYKFRSMRTTTEGPFRPTQPVDERCTRVGRWLRRTRLDELPQLWNILRGEMAFVGPRPFALEEEQGWAQSIPFYSLRWNVKPGATGWAQVRRGYCATRMDNVEKLAYDLFYIKNFSFGLDALILFHTTKILLQGRGSR